MGFAVDETIREAEQSSVTTLTDAERRDAAINLAEVALRRRWSEKFRDQQLKNVLQALDLFHPKGS